MKYFQARNRAIMKFDCPSRVETCKQQCDSMGSACHGFSYMEHTRMVTTRSSRGQANCFFFTLPAGASLRDTRTATNPNGEVDANGKGPFHACAHKADGTLNET